MSVFVYACVLAIVCLFLCLCRCLCLCLCMFICVCICVYDRLCIFVVFSVRAYVLVYFFCMSVFMSVLVFMPC